MLPRISEETVERIRMAHELGLSVRAGAAFAGISPTTFVKWEKELGLKTKLKQHGNSQWTQENSIGQLRRIRTEEGISGFSGIEQRHLGVYRGIQYHVNGGYKKAFESAFGFPFSKGAVNLAERIHELLESGHEIDPAKLSKEREVFGTLIRLGQFDAILRFALEAPAARKRTVKENQGVLARMILRYLSKPRSYVTPEMKKAFPAPYRGEVPLLLEYGAQLGLLVPVSVNGITAYRASNNAIESIREMLIRWHEEDSDFSEVLLWKRLLEMQGQEGDAIRSFDKGLQGLPYQDRRIATFYLAGVLCKPGNPDFRRTAIVSDVISKYSGEDGIPPELRATLQLLPPEDPRTADTLGEYLLRRLPREVGLERLRRMSVQSNPEAAYQAMRQNAGSY